MRRAGGAAADREGGGGPPLPEPDDNSLLGRPCDVCGYLFCPGVPRSTSSQRGRAPPSADITSAKTAALTRPPRYPPLVDAVGPQVPSRSAARDAPARPPGIEIIEVRWFVDPSSCRGEREREREVRVQREEEEEEMARKSSRVFAIPVSWSAISRMSIYLDVR